VLVTTLSLGACAHGDPQDSPSNATNTTSQSAPPDQLASVAKTYFNCMTEANLPVELVANGDGDMAIVRFTGDHWLMVRSPEAGSLRWSQAQGPATDPAVLKMVKDFFAQGNQPGLMIDGVDYSPIYLHCLQVSGYDEEAAYGTINMDAELVARQVDANNRWAACARKNGWPMIEDSAIPAADDSDWPATLIPVTIGIPKLKALLKACPNFDPAEQAFMDNWWKTNPSGGYPVDYMPDPILDFYLPSHRDNPNSTADPTAEEQAALENLSNLRSVLTAASDAYWQTHVPSGGST